MIAADAHPPRLRAVVYDAQRFEQVDLASIVELESFLDHDDKLWVDVQGLGDAVLLDGIAKLFDIHELALEDAVNVPQRPDTDQYPSHQLIVTRAVSLVDREAELVFEQVTLFVGPRVLLTIQERHSERLEPLLERLGSNRGSIREYGVDHLAYAVVDTVIDGYFPVVEKIGDRLDDLEARVLREAKPEVLGDVRDVKRDLLLLRRALWPMREMVNELIRDSSPFLGPGVRVYLHDCYDHCIQLLDVVETYRELGADLTATYLSAIGNRTNEVVKVLTMMASTFIPLSFIAGVYGMNFRHMPELHERWAYPAILAVMVIVAVSMLLFFRRRGWIGQRERSGED
jgi:magnesium transporter